MSKTIWKFPAPNMPGYAFIQAPVGTKFISVDEQDADDFVFWGEADGSAAPGRIEIAVVWTGGLVPEGDWRFIGTLQAINGLVYHFYQRQ